MTLVNFERDRRVFLQHLENGKFVEAWEIWSRSLEQSPSQVEASEALRLVGSASQPVKAEEIAFKNLILARLYELAGNGVHAGRYGNEFLEEARIAGLDDRYGRLLLARLNYSGRKWKEALHFFDAEFFRGTFGGRAEGTYWKALASLELGEVNLVYEAFNQGREIAAHEGESIWTSQLFEIGIRAAVAEGNQGESLRRCSEFEVFATSSRPDLRTEALVLSAAVSGVFLAWRDAVSKASQAMHEKDRAFEEEEDCLLWAIQEAAKGFVPVPYRKKFNQRDLFEDTKLTWRRGYAFTILSGGDFVRTFSEGTDTDTTEKTEFLRRASAGLGTIPPQAMGFLNLEGPKNAFSIHCSRLWEGFHQEQSGAEALSGAVLSYRRVIREADLFPVLGWMGLKRYEALQRRQGNQEVAQETVEKIGRMAARIGFEEYSLPVETTGESGSFSAPDISGFLKTAKNDENLPVTFLEFCRDNDWAAMVVLETERGGYRLIGTSTEGPEMQRATEEALLGTSPQGFIQLQIATSRGAALLFGSGPASIVLESLRVERERLALAAKVEKLLPFSQVPKPSLEVMKGSEFGIIGTSKPITKVLEMLGRLRENQSEKPVLITGETGTGKEVIARAIHAVSPRRSEKLITLNCGAISRELIQSELFGHKKGSFTGANEDRLGAIRASDGGTLFLDEIGELPLDLQVNLLRFLQEGEVTPVGEEKSKKVDVRVIAATNRNLEEEIQKGTFREDLFQRLRVVEVSLPPLRERREDIPLLVEHFLSKEGQGIKCSQAALAFLTSQKWKGNIRELQNKLSSVVALLGLDESILQPYHFTGAGLAEVVPAEEEEATEGIPEKPWYLVDIRNYRGMSLSDAEWQFSVHLLLEERRRLRTWEEFYELYPGTSKSAVFRRLDKIEDRETFHSSPRRTKSAEKQKKGPEGSRK